MLSQQSVDLDDVLSSDATAGSRWPSAVRWRAVSEPSPERPVVVYSSDATPTATAGFGSIERATAHLLLLATEKSDTYQVDFADQPISPDAAIHVQPGQVHRWPDGSTGRAMAVAIDPSIVPAGLFGPWNTSVTVLLGPASDVVHAIANDLATSMRRSTVDYGVTLASADLLVRHLAAARGPAVSASSQHVSA